jgi:hypothetical protein
MAMATATTPASNSALLFSMKSLFPRSFPGPETPAAGLISEPLPIFDPAGANVSSTARRVNRCSNASCGASSASLALAAGVRE